VVGEPYWRSWPLPGGVDDAGFVPLAATVDRFVSAGLRLETLIDSSKDDWDRYESLHWRALEEWLAANPDDADDRFENVRDWLVAEFRKSPAERDPVAQGVFVELELDEAAGRRHLLESERFRALLAEPALARAA